jgi:YVTN family beta-propeller protein
VTATVTIGGTTPDVDVDPLTGTIYVTNQDTNTVAVISGQSDTVTTTVAVGDTPGAVAVMWQTGSVYVTNEQDDTVSVLSA